MNELCGETVMAVQQNSCVDTDLDDLLGFLKLMRGVIPEMPKAVAELPLWFDNIQIMFKIYRVPEALEGRLLLQFLSRDCTMEAARLMTRGQRSFSELKRHVFEYLGVSANRLRELFGETVKLPDETWWSASVRARTLLDAYLDSRKVKSFEELKDLLISDRIKVMATAEAARHVVLTECGDWMKPKELSRCLEHFDETKRICLKTEHAPEKPKVAEKAGAKQSRDKKRRKCFACKAVGHLISECPVVDPRRETRTLDVPETSEVGDFTGRNTDPEDRASRKTRFKEEPARLHRQFRAAFHERSGRGLGGRERRDFSLLGDLLCELTMAIQKRSHPGRRDSVRWRVR